MEGLRWLGFWSVDVVKVTLGDEVRQGWRGGYGLEAVRGSQVGLMVC